MRVSSHVPGIDALRFFAALLVCFFHLTYWGNAADGTTADALQGAAKFARLGEYTRSGWVGVEIFFVISGFVIAYSAQGKDAFGFFRSRILRLVPAAVACATITVLVALSTGLFSPAYALRAYLASIFFFPFQPWVDGVYWSLGVEISFYGAVWLLIVSGAFSYFEMFILIMGTSSVLAAVVDWLAPFPFYSTRWMELLLIRNGMCFALGSLIWLIACHGFTWRRGLAATLFLFGSLVEISIATFPGNRGSPVVPAFLFLSSMAAMLIAIYSNDRLRNRASTQGTSFGRAAGLVTYPLYLTHNVVGASLIRIFVNAGMSETAALLLSLFSIAIIVAIVVTILETQIRLFLSELLPKPT